MKENIKELRQQYINNPPEGMTPKDIRRMSDEELLDMDYFLNEDLDDIFEEGGGFFIFYIKMSVFHARLCAGIFIQEFAEWRTFL